MASETWAEPPAHDVVDPSLTGTFVRGRRPLGRTTVLPRLDAKGERPAIVRPAEARYEQQGEIGRGGLGVVIGARDLDIGRMVAIKQVRSDVRSDKALLRFAEEIRTVGVLDHPNIVPIHDVGADETGQPYFVMKYVEGDTMAAVLKRLRDGDAKARAHWTFARRMDVFRKVLEAIDFAHSRGVVHRNLKPENLMLGAHGEVHVLDWGIAHRAQLPDLSGLPGPDPLSARVTQTRDGNLLGTPAYMSPEQADGKPAGPASDIYSLGVILYEWLTLTHYLGELEAMDDVLDGVRKLTPPLAHQLEVAGQLRVPAELGWMAARAMQKDPAERYPSVAAWLAALDRLDDGEIEVRCAVTFQKHWLARTVRVIDSYPAVWTAALAAVLVLGAVGFVGLLAAAFALGALLV